MRNLIERVKDRLDDPILMTWALHRYEHVALRGPDFCRPMEDAWFHDAALRRWIDSGDPGALANLFRILPARLFAQLRPEIVERWSAWTGVAAAKAINVVLEDRPEEVVALLARHFADNFPDLDKTMAAIEAIADLPPAHVRGLLDDVTERVLGLRNGSFTKQMLLDDLLRPTAVLNPGRLAGLVETRVRDNQDQGDRLLRNVYSALFDDTTLLEKARELMDGRPVQPYRSLQPLFCPGAPLGDGDRILGQPDPWPAAKDFLDQHRAASAATETAHAVVSVLESLHASGLGKEELGKEDAEKLGKKFDHLAGFAVATVLEVFRRNDIGASGLSIGETLDVLALDVQENRHAVHLTQRLAAFPPHEVVQGLGERLPAVRDDWGGVHLATVAGELRLVDGIPLLIDCLGSERGDYLCEAARKYLVQIGEPAELALIAQWDKLDSSQKIYGRTALEEIGGEATGRFAVERFMELINDDLEGWCLLAEAAPSKQAIDLLAPEVRRKQPQIDECFYRLCMVMGHEADHLTEIRDRVIAHRRQLLARRSAIVAGDFLNPRNTITLTLKCERCGDVNRYEVKSIVAGKNTTGTPYFVGDDLRCVSCDKPADFEFTAETTMQMMASFVRLAAAGPEQAESKGPMRLISVNYRGETRPAPEVLAELKAAVAAQPEDVVNHLRLARFQYVFGRRGRAAECYGRALEIEPDSIEAGLGIAHVLADTGKRGNAFDRLSNLLERRSSWRFFRTDEIPRQMLADDFSQLFTQLQLQIGVRERPLLPMSDHKPSLLVSNNKPSPPTSFKRSGAKIGRNDPCPCGSGKKYKKCCAAARESTAY